ncbi:hypothetical protein [Caudoviricetes sp.]|nr:hypothetical protein [Caudoviricetes sp.]
MSCKGCKRDQSTTLVGGDKVCSWCHLWALECEARELLRRPLWKRRQDLKAREEIRGKKAVDQLREVMLALFNKARS